MCAARVTWHRLHWHRAATDYEIDLRVTNARAFRQLLAPFIEHPLKASRGQRLRPGRTTASRQHSGDVRAKDHGVAVSDRDRIPASVAEECQAAEER